MASSSLLRWRVLLLFFSCTSGYSSNFLRHISKERSRVSWKLSSSNDLDHADMNIIQSLDEFREKGPAILSLTAGSWVKFISGASNQDLPLIRNMCYLYTLAGVDCIDMSADPAVVIVAKEGIKSALLSLGSNDAGPLIMISVNDDNDPHFRKAVFNPEKCPAECPRPCEKVCPAWAIPPVPSKMAAIKSDDEMSFGGAERTLISTQSLGASIGAPSPSLPSSSSPSISPSASSSSSLSLGTDIGVIADRCYGCGRCVPICPLGLIITESYTVDKSAINKLFSSGAVDAIEIHTLPNHEQSFFELWNAIGDEVLSKAKILSVSFPNMGENTIPYLEELQKCITSRPSWRDFKGVQIWQADGRPMSGDIGKGTTHKSSNLASFVLSELESREKRKVVGGGEDGEGTGNSGGVRGERGVGGDIFSDLQMEDKRMSEIEDVNKVKKIEQTYNRTDTINIDSIDNLINISNGLHHIQLAGGTNNYSAQSAENEGLLGAQGFGGFAFGGYARKIIGEILHELEDEFPGGMIEDHPIVLDKCLEFARNLVNSVKKV